MKKALMSLVLGTALVFSAHSAFAMTGLLKTLLKTVGERLPVTERLLFGSTKMNLINLKNGLQIGLTEQPVTFGSLQTGTKITIEMVPTRVNPMVLKKAADRYIDKVEEFQKAHPSVDFEFGEDKTGPIRPLSVNANEIDAGVFDKLVNELIDAVDVN